MRCCVVWKRFSAAVALLVLTWAAVGCDPQYSTPTATPKQPAQTPGQPAAQTGSETPEGAEVPVPTETEKAPADEPAPGGSTTGDPAADEPLAAPGEDKAADEE